MRGLGSTFGAYNLDQVVMTDAVSVTYRATMARELAVAHRGVSPNLSRPVLLRISDPFEGDDADERAAVFLRRVRTTTAVGHPAIIKAVDAGEIDGRVFIATRWTSGLTLEELIRREGRLEPDAACALLLPVAQGLDAMHAAGVVHGAVSPRTIWMDESQGTRSARIGGLGLDTPLRDHTFGGPGDGAPGDAFYVAPEQFHATTPAASTDQYALACTLYHCVIGRPPFQSATASERFATNQPPVFDFGVDELPDEVCGAIAMGMQIQPQLRYANCTALLLAAGLTPDGTQRAHAEPRAGAIWNGANGSAPQPSADRDEPILPLRWPAIALLVLVCIIVALLAVVALR